jgi:F0F1-type ATP synthase membrane subunit c/vacuolar-type H+-ATPase subunit K
MLIGQATGGGPSIFALVVGLLILFKALGAPNEAGGNVLCIFVGSGLAIGLGCFGSGLGCGWPAGYACDGVARNPRLSTLLTTRMIIGQAVAQSPAIFATVVALMLIFVFEEGGTNWVTMGVALGSGVAVGASAFGPGIGSGYTAGGALDGIGRWPENHGATLRTMLVGQGVCQTPAIFGILVVFIMMFALPDMRPGIVGFARTFGAGIAVGLGGVGPGVGSGIAGGAGCEATALRPRHGALVQRTMLTGQAVSQSTAIYALIIALVILYVV